MLADTENNMFIMLPRIVVCGDYILFSVLWDCLKQKCAPLRLVPAHVLAWISAVRRQEDGGLQG